MASSMIHIALANELNKTLNKDKAKLLIGTIAPDISKLIGENKVRSHFLIGENTDIPQLDKFLDKYKDNLDDDFVLGYYIHLYTDYLWFKYFLPEFYNKDKHWITKLDGTVVNCVGEMGLMYIYNDYTNLNVQLIDEYNLDLKMFYNDIPEINNIIDEIPMDKLDLIVNKAGEIIENTKVRKNMTFDIDGVKKFISLSTNLILSNLRELNVI